MLKTKPGFLLRSLGNEAMVIAIGEASETFNGMIRLNETGTFYWKALEQGTTEDQLVAMTMERFSGLEESTARQDVRDFLAAISPALTDNGADN